MNTIEPIHPSSLHLGEGPIWDDRLDTLYYVDILDKALYSWNYESHAKHSYSFDEFISAIALTEDSNYILVALESGIHRYNLITQEINFISQPEPFPDYRFNDGCVDWDGNWWIGSMNNINNGPDATHLPDSTLYLVKKEKTTKLLDDVTISNGIAFQKPYVYYIDSKKNNVRMFKYENDELQFVETLLQMNDSTTLDGMTLSKSNKLYIANWGGSKIIVFDLHKKKIIEEIVVPALNPTSCCFGGPFMDELFITTSSIDDENQALAGVYKMKTEDIGIIENRIAF